MLWKHECYGMKKQADDSRGELPIAEVRFASNGQKSGISANFPAVQKTGRTPTPPPAAARAA